MADEREGPSGIGGGAENADDSGGGSSSNNSNSNNNDTTKTDTVASGSNQQLRSPAPAPSTNVRGLSPAAPASPTTGGGGGGGGSSDEENRLDFASLGVPPASAKDSASGLATPPPLSDDDGDDEHDDNGRGRQRLIAPGTPQSQVSYHSTDRHANLARAVSEQQRQPLSPLRQRARNVVPGTPDTFGGSMLGGSHGARSAPGTPDSTRRSPSGPQTPVSTGRSPWRGSRGNAPGGGQPRPAAVPGTPDTVDSRRSALPPSTPERRDVPSHSAGGIAGFDQFAAPGTPNSYSSRFSQRSGFSHVSQPQQQHHYQHQHQHQQPHHPPQGGGDWDDGMDDAGDMDAQMSDAVIWGTSVGVDDVVTRFKRFIRHFIDEDSGSEPLYTQKIDEIVFTGANNLNIDCNHLLQFRPTRRTYDQLIKYPQEIIPLLDLVVNQERAERRRILSEIHPEMNLDEDNDAEPPRVQVRTFNLREHKKMRDLDPMDIDHLVSIRGMIIRNGAIIPDMKQAFYQCSRCHNPVLVSVERGRIDEPARCDACSNLHTLELIHNRCIFTDKQMVKLQETPESIPEGETPATITMFSFDDLVDVTKPGDKVEVTGIFRAVPQRVNSRRRTVNSVYRTYIDVLHFRKAEKGRVTADENAGARTEHEFHVDFEEGAETKELQQAKAKRCAEMAADPNIYENLVASVCPSIWEMDDVKKGVLCQVVSGSNKILPSGKFRGEINILLCGDPGTSKSQLLGYVNKLVPRGIYTSGKGSSAVGLTAYVMKDPETKEIVLESGALVLSDRGICCIDEFDKMSDSTRSVLHEVMEQQTISIAKAGIICTLNARTSVLASANPVESRYNPNLSVVQNLRLPPSLLSRFDLIYLILDKPDPNRDRRLAQHLVSLYYADPMMGRSRVVYSKEDISLYLSHVKQNITPRISDEAAAALAKGYLDMRQLGYIGSSKRIVTATPRQLESLIRLSEAIAKIRSSNVVSREDVDEAVRLMHVATQKTATDPRTGRIDMDMITTGTSTRERENIKALKQAVKEILETRKATGGGKSFSVSDVVGFLQEQSDVDVDVNDLTKACSQLAAEDFMTFNERSQRMTLA